MLTSDTPCRPRPSVVFTRLDEAEAVLLHLDTKRYYSSNETGARIWELVQDGRSPGKISWALQNEYDIEPEDAMAVLLEFLDEMCQEGLVHTQAPSPRG